MKKDHFFLIILIIVILFNPIPSFSQKVPEGKASLSGLIQEALSQNPLIKAARNEWEAALKVIPQAKSLPDPMLSYSYFGQSIETRLGPQRKKNFSTVLIERVSQVIEFSAGYITII